jgi:hypothetical protein
VTSAGANAYRVDVRQDEGGWVVAIVDPNGRDVSTRACGHESQAWTYASTVRQHIYWLSEEKFREYYQLPGTDDGRS